VQPKTVATCPVTALRPGGPYEIIGGRSGKACIARLNYGQKKLVARVSIGGGEVGRIIEEYVPFL
jgi:hypothetical protein